MSELLHTDGPVASQDWGCLGNRGARYYQVDAPAGWDGQVRPDETADVRGLLCLKAEEPWIWLLPIDASLRFHREDRGRPDDHRAVSSLIRIVSLVILPTLILNDPRLQLIAG
jgi:hypothetical protein